MPEKEKILVVLSRFPYPLEKGDKLRAYYQIKELSVKYDITLFCTHEKKLEKTQISELEKYCKKLITHRLTLASKLWHSFGSFVRKQPLQIGYFYTRSGKNKIKQELQESKYKHIYCQLVRCSELVKDIHTIPKTLDYMDTLSIGVQRRISSQPFLLRWIFKREHRLLSEYERRIFDYFENRTIISEQDRSLIRHQEREKIIVIPNGVDRSFLEYAKNEEKTHDLVFVGNMSYPPNIEAVKYLENSILSKNKDLTLLVSGSTPHPSVIKIAESNPQITLTGWVDDIRTSYIRGRIFIAPMTIGTGMQNKLLEAMALGIPAITTSLANNAIKAKDERDILVSDNPEEIYSFIKKLLSDQSYRNQLGENGKKFVEQHYSWSKTTAILIDRIERDFN